MSVALARLVDLKAALLAEARARGPEPKPQKRGRKVPQRKWRAHGSGAASEWEHAEGASRRRVGPGEGASPKARVPVG